MSRSAPIASNEPNPATRFWEWSGKNGIVEYYDKEKKEKVAGPTAFTFLLLDALSCVKGWSDLHQAGIFSNEVKDTRTDAMTVRPFKCPIIAEGLYADIKDKVKAAGGHYVANLYIGVKQGALEIQALQFKGAALGAWMEFQKENKQAIYDKAICIEGSKTGKKGSVTFKTPVFKLKELTAETNEEAKALDTKLQAYLSAYFKRGKAKAEEAREYGDEDYVSRGEEAHVEQNDDPIDEDSIPF